MKGNGVVISKLAKRASRQHRCTIRLHVCFQSTNGHIVTILMVTVLLETCKEIGLVLVANCNTHTTAVIHKQVDTNKSMHQGAARETRGTINMDKLVQCSDSMCFSVSMEMMVEVAMDTGVTATSWPKSLVQLEQPSDYEVTHMQLELGQGVIMRMTQTMMPNIQRSCRGGLGGACRGDHSRSHKC